VPLAALVLTLVQQRRLGLSVIVAFVWILLGSAALVVLGIALAVGAKRRSASPRALVLGTIVASMPLLLLVALWLTGSIR